MEFSEGGFPKLLRCAHLQAGHGGAVGVVHVRATAAACAAHTSLPRGHDDMIALCPVCLSKVVAFAVELRGVHPA